MLYEYNAGGLDPRVQTKLNEGLSYYVELCTEKKLYIFKPHERNPKGIIFVFPNSFKKVTMKIKEDALCFHTVHDVLLY